MDRLVKVTDEYVEDLPKDDPLGDRRIYPIGWRGRVSAKLAAAMVKEGAAQDLTADTSDADDGGARQASAALKSAKTAVTKAQKAQATATQGVVDAEAALAVAREGGDMTIIADAESALAAAKDVETAASEAVTAAKEKLAELDA